jgi:transposase InsO family protein
MILYATAKEFLLLDIPGFPDTEQGIKFRAKSLAWPSRPRKGRGGGVEYPILGTPEANKVLSAEQQTYVRSILEAQSSEAETTTIKGIIETKRAAKAQHQETQAEAIQAINALPDHAMERMNARTQILNAWVSFQRSHIPPIGKTASEPLFVIAYNEGQIKVDDWVREIVPTLSVSTLRRWQQIVQQKGISGLGSSYGNRKGCGLIDSQEEVQTFIVAMMTDFPHVEEKQVLIGLQARFGKRSDVKIPSHRSIERWMKAWKASHAQTFTALSNPDEWKNKFMVAYGNASENIERLNQRWELDGTPADLLLADGKRYTLIGAIDVFGRRPKLLLSPTSRAVSVAALLRRAILDWGVPEMIKTDNGSDYASKHINMVAMGLGIEQVFCPPFSPWHKPHIERFFRTFSHSFLELLPGFIGHNVAERKALEARKSFADRLMKRGETVEIGLTPEEFQRFCDRWCEEYYMHEPHEGLNGKTPWQVVSGWPHPIRRIDDERVLDILLAEAPNGDGQRTVHKGGIRIDGAWFIAPELEAYVGQKVQVRFDPMDLGRIYVFGRQEQGFVCVAECPERTGIDRQEVAIKTREEQKKRVQEERRALKAAAKKVKTDEVVNEILEARAEKAGKLTRFPSPIEHHDSEGIRAAAEAIEAMDEMQRQPAPHDEVDLAIGRALIARLDEEAKQRAEIEDPLDRYKRLKAKSDEGLAVSQDEQRFMRNFEGTPRYRAWLDFEELRRESLGPT